MRPFFVSTKTMAAEPTPSGVSGDFLKRLGGCHRLLSCLVPRAAGGPSAQAQRRLEAFARLKEEGLIRHIAVSTHLEHEHVAAMLDEGQGLFESMLIGLNIQNYHLRHAGVQAAAERGMAVVTMNTLGGGVLTNHEDRFRSVVGDKDESILDTAIRFNLSIPGISSVLVGFRNKEDVDTAVEAVSAFEPLTRRPSRR